MFIKIQKHKVDTQFKWKLIILACKQGYGGVSHVQEQQQPTSIPDYLSFASLVIETGGKGERAWD